MSSRSLRGFVRASRGWVLLCMLAVCCGVSGQPATHEGESARIELFVRSGCAHCDAAKAFLAGLERERPALQVQVRDVGTDSAALELLVGLAREAGVERPGVPAIRVAGRLIVGFDRAESTGARVRALLDHDTEPAGGDASVACSLDAVAGCAAPPPESFAIDLLGHSISAERLGLPLFTVVIGLLDGLNPCSMWVLILMISMLATLGDRRRMLAIAGTFVLIEGVAYFAFMAAWLNVFLLVGWSRTSEVVIALLALLAGAINLKDFVRPGRGPSLSIPVSAKPGIYARMRGILRAEHLFPAVLGSAALAVLVQAVELLCTSGFPAVYTRLLTLTPMERPVYYAYLLLYNVMYMLDDIIVLGLGIWTLSRRRLQEREGRWLKLLAGLVMVGLALYLLLAR